jgi:hypothetical protein
VSSERMSCRNVTQGHDLDPDLGNCSSDPSRYLSAYRLPIPQTHHLRHINTSLRAGALSAGIHSHRYNRTVCLRINRMHKSFSAALCRYTRTNACTRVIPNKCRQFGLEQTPDQSPLAAILLRKRAIGFFGTRLLLWGRAELSRHFHNVSFPRPVHPAIPSCCMFLTLYSV